jgi:hypothetical protein
MDDADRLRLLGTYRTPRFRIGQRVRCQVHRRDGLLTGPFARLDRLRIKRREPC